MYVLRRLQQHFPAVELTTEPLLHQSAPQQLIQSLTFDQLYTVRTIVSTGSFHEASKILCLTQPAISQRVRHIEHLLGAPVFDRHSGIGVTLTPVGEALLEFCERSIRGLDEFSAELDAVRSPTDGAELRVVAPSDIIQYLLVGMLPVFQERHPQLTVRVRQSVDRNDVVKLLTSGKADLAFDRSPTHSSLLTVARMTEQLHLVVPEGHEMLRLPVRDRPSAIGKYPFATYSPGMRTRDLIQRWAAKVGAIIVPQIESRSVAVMKEAVLQHNAIAVLPAMAVSPEVRAGALVMAEIADMPLTRTTAITARHGEERSPRVRVFVEELMTVCTMQLGQSLADVRWATSQAEQPTG